MSSMILTRKGSSIIMWSSLFVVMLGIFALAQKPFSNALTHKTFQTAEYLMWSSWGMDDDDIAAEIADGSGFDNTRTRTRVGQWRTRVKHEGHNGVFSSFLDPKKNKTALSRVTASTGDGFEVLIQQDQFLDQTIFNIADPEFPE